MDVSRRNLNLPGQKKQKKMPGEWVCKLHGPNLVTTLLKWLGFGPDARQQLQSGDPLELLQLSDDQIDGLERLGDFDKAELKRWKRAATAFADNAGHQSLVCGGVRYALYIHLSDWALELAGTDLEPDDVVAAVVSVEPRRGFSIQAKLTVASALLGKLKKSLHEDTSIDRSFFCSV